MKYPVTAIWRNRDYDVDVIIVGCYGEHAGVVYYKTESGTGIRADELVFPSFFRSLYNNLFKK